MYLHCSPCDVRQRNCRDWYKHLNSPKHQEVAKESVNNCSSPMSYRSIVCSEFNKEIMKHLMLDEYNLITYFASFGLVHDIYYKYAGDGGLTACLILLDSVEVVKGIMGEWQNVYRVDTQQFKAIIGMINRRCDMTGFAFQKLMEDPAEEVFYRRHKELVQICNEIPLEQQFYEWNCTTSLSNEDIWKREGFLRELETVLQQEFPNCKCKPFGSYLIGVSDRDGDLDVFVDVGVNLNKSLESSNDSEMIMESENNDTWSLDEVFDRVLKHIRRTNSIQHPGTKRRTRRFKSIIPIHARIPIIRLIHEETQLHCDLSFKSCISVINSNLMKFYTTYDPRFRPLLAFIRYWGRFHTLIGPNKMKSYALSLMVIVYLNQAQILPSVHYLQEQIKETEPKDEEDKKNNTQPLIPVDGWNASFFDNVKVVRQSIADTGYANVPLDFYESGLSCMDVLELAKGWFKFFGHFDFESFLVCPLLGTLIEKATFQNQEALTSAEFPCSFEKLKEFRYSSPLCIQDPFILDFNVTSNVTNKLLKRFTSLCRETAMSLSRILQSTTPNQQEGNTSHHNNLFSEVFLNIEDLLSSKQVLNHGQPNEELHLLSMPGVSVNSTQQVVQQRNEIIASTIPQTADINSNSGNSNFAMNMPMNMPMMEARNFEDNFTEDIDVNDGRANRSVLPPAGVSLLLPHNNPIVLTYSLELSISTEFQQLFMIILSSLDEVEAIENRMKIAWTLFVSDFFGNIFDKGFGLKTIAQRKLPYHLNENFNIEEARARKVLDDRLPYSIAISRDAKTGRFTVQALHQYFPTTANNNNMPSKSARKKRKLSPGYLQQQQLEFEKSNVMNKRGKDNVQQQPIQMQRQQEDFTNDDETDDVNNFDVLPGRGTFPTPFDILTLAHRAEGAAAATSTSTPPPLEIKNGDVLKIVNQASNEQPIERIQSHNQKILSICSIPPMDTEIYAKLPSGFRKSFSLEFEVEGRADSFIGRERRHFERVLFSQKAELLSINPITLEEGATRSFKGINSVKVESRKGVNFLCNISVDTLLPLGMVHFREVLDSPNKFPVVHLIRDIGFSQMFHQYTVFRLKKMLSKTKSN